jgi:hypothetical protein
MSAHELPPVTCRTIPRQVRSPDRTIPREVSPPDRTAPREVSVPVRTILREVSPTRTASTTFAGDDTVPTGDGKQPSDACL